MIISGNTDVGKVRSSNEDYYALLEGNELPEGIDGVIVIADGMGGHAAGEVASKMATEGVTRRITDQSLFQAVPETVSLTEYLGQVLIDVNREVYAASQDPEYKGMGTTCTVGALQAGELHIAHVGDSRAYRLRSGNLEQLTQDHSWIAEQIMAGNITVEQSKSHPYRNVITKTVGTDSDVIPQTKTVSVESGDKILVCSDGLHSMVDDTEIGSILLRGDTVSIVNELIDMANAKGGTDNITVAVAEVIGPETIDQSRRGIRKVRRHKIRRSPGLVGWIKSRVLKFWAKNF